MKLDLSHKAGYRYTEDRVREVLLEWVSGRLLISSYLTTTATADAVVQTHFELQHDS